MNTTRNIKSIPGKLFFIQAVCWVGMFLISVLGVTVPVSAELPAGLISYYPLDGNVLDMGPNGYDGTAYSVALAADRSGNPGRAYSFDGTGAHIQAGSFDLPSVFSLSLWVNPQGTTAGKTFFGKQSSGSIPIVSVGFSADDRYLVSLHGESHAAGDVTIGWQHIAVVVEKASAFYSRVLFYKNGRLLWSKSHFDPIEDITGLPIAMGASWSGAAPAHFFSGEMDDVRIYGRTLSQTEVQLLYDPTLGLDITSDGDVDGADLGFFSESMGKFHWYRDLDGDGYSDGTSVWGQNRPDNTYYSQGELDGISGDCDDLNPDINPEITGPECPPFGACCYNSEEDCPSVVKCDDNVSEQACINELNGSFYGERSCSDLSAAECAAGSETGACCRSLEGMCEDGVAASQCEGEGESFFASRSCETLLTEECQAAVLKGSCCHPKISYVNESGVFPVQCLENRTEYQCQLLQGTWTQGGACTDEACAPYGGCCYTDSEGIAKCANGKLPAECTTLGGTFFADQQCSELTMEQCSVIPETVGACCLSDLSSTPVRCIDGRTQTQCESLGGNWFEEDQCADLTLEQCPAIEGTTGACCNTIVAENGSTTAVCNDGLNITDCTDGGGSFFADRACADLTNEECPVLAGVGSCCHPKISYVNESGVFPVQCLDSLTEYKCKLLQGTWNEGGICEDLSEEECPSYGGCCYNDGTADKCANWMLETSCAKLSGTFHPNEKCSDLTGTSGCPGPVSTGACCLTSSGLSTSLRCIDARTLAQCTALGGSWHDEEACADLTYAQCPEVAELSGACCVSYGSGSSATANCFDSMTGSACSDAGGSLYANRLCSDLTSEECPRPAAVGSCCHPKISYVNESGVFPVQCLDSLTEYKCKLLQGTWNEGGICEDLSEEECPSYGGCCYNDGTADKCANWMLETSCAKLSGTFHPNEKCSDLTGTSGCPGPVSTGACCLTSSGLSTSLRCLDARTLAQCTALGGSWHEEEACADLTYAQCPEVAELSGACCVSYGSGSSATANCFDSMTGSACSDAGGSLYANRLCSDLTSEECPRPAAVGSCCHPKISYVNESGVFPVQCLNSLTEYKCKLLQGTWNEGGICEDLSEEECPSYGGCCYNDGTADKCANWMLETNCDKLSGTFHPNEKCSDLTGTSGCPGPVSTGACCLTSSGLSTPVRCLDARTLAQCTALGGFWHEEEACADLTYAQCPEVAELSGACCVSYGSGSSATANCFDSMTGSACSDAGGSLYANRLCSDLTSEECPRPAAVGSCCHPKISYVNESGVFPVQCLDSLTEYKCKLLQGAWSEAGICADLTEEECPPYGSCCYKDTSTGMTKCANWMLETSCAKLSGTFHPNETCAQAGCVDPPVVSACCLTTEDSDAITPVRCIDARTQIQCASIGGTWFEPEDGDEDGVQCSELTYGQCPAIAEATGACCITMVSGGTTTAMCNDNVTGSDCSDAGGSFFADRLCSDLTSEECPVPAATGSCCHPKISYVNESGVFPVQCLDNLTEYKCKILQGSWSEDGVCAYLSETECAPYGACCYKDTTGAKCANWMLETNCNKLSGKFYPNTQCADAGCYGSPDLGACCLSNVDGATISCLDDRTNAQCEVLGGEWYQHGDEKITCEMLIRSEKCTLIGACCYENEYGVQCEDFMRKTDCEELNGRFSDGYQCSDPEFKCETTQDPVGACCLSFNQSPNMRCVDARTNEQCKELGGVWFSDVSACEDLTYDQCPAIE